MSSRKNKAGGHNFRETEDNTIVSLDAKAAMKNALTPDEITAWLITQGEKQPEPGMSRARATKLVVELISSLLTGSVMDMVAEGAITKEQAISTVMRAVEKQIAGQSSVSVAFEGPLPVATISYNEDDPDDVKEAHAKIFAYPPALRKVL